MEITVNGDAVTTTASTLIDYLDSIGINPGRIAVELNQEIVPKKDYATTPLKPGDRVEIVQFVGGG